jgi:hypothetical protein
MAGLLDRLYVPNGLGVDAISGGQPVTEYHAGLVSPTQITGPTPRGQLVPGNIDLANRPHIRNRDGSISTVYSASFGDGSREVLLPLVGRDRIMNDKEAWDEYRKTGKHLGIFDTPGNADAYASRLHEQQAHEGDNMAGILGALYARGFGR